MPCKECGETERLHLHEHYDMGSNGHYETKYQFECLVCGETGIKAHYISAACRWWGEELYRWHAKPVEKPQHYGNW